MKTKEKIWPYRMNPTDALLWYMDRIPDTRSTIGALMVLERSPSREDIRHEFERQSLFSPRMRQRVGEVPLSLAPPEWVEDEQFDIDYHLRFLAVPEPRGVEDFLAELSPLYAQAFDPQRPLWEAYVAEGLAGGKSAVFIKMHHCATDGVGGTQMFEELLNSRETGRKKPPRRTDGNRDTGPGAMLWRALQYNLEQAAADGTAVLGALADSVRHPEKTLEDLGRTIRALSGLSREVVAPTARSPIKEHRSLSRYLSTFEMSIKEIDDLRRPLEATNNDIVLTVVSGAMQRWHAAHGTEVHELRAMVPVSLRRDGDAVAGNRIALLAVALPTDEFDPLERLRIIQEHMGAVKADRRASLYPLVARAMIALPSAISEAVARQQSAKTNFLCTNVPGASTTCYLAGQKIERIYAYGPLVGDHPLAIALYSYLGTMYVGLDVDPFTMHDLPTFRRALAEAYEEVLQLGRARRQAARARERQTARRTKSRKGSA